MREAAELMFGRRRRRSGFGEQSNCKTGDVKCISNWFNRLSPAEKIINEPIATQLCGEGFVFENGMCRAVISEPVVCDEGFVFRTGMCRPIKRNKDVKSSRGGNMNPIISQEVASSAFKQRKLVNAARPATLASFGKKRKGSRRKGCKSKGPTKKLPSKIRKLCKRLKIKTTKKVGRRRVCKSLSTIMKQIKKKMKKITRRVR
jgi:hypothetical protein